MGDDVQVLLTPTVERLKSLSHLPSSEHLAKRAVHSTAMQTGSDIPHRNWHKLLPLVIVLGGACVWLARFNSNDIDYKGKRLSEYVSELPVTYPRFCAFEPEQVIEDSEALRAIRTIGTNCFSILFVRLTERPIIEERLRWRLNFLLPPQTADAWDERLHSYMESRWQAVTAVNVLQGSGCDMRSFIERLEKFKQSSKYQARSDSGHDVRAAIEFLSYGLAGQTSSNLNQSAQAKVTP